MKRLVEMNFFYGWVIVTVCGLLLFVAFGIRLSFAVFYVALLETFGWPRASTALIYSAGMVVFTLVSTPAGMALDRWGVRRVFCLGAGLLGLGLLLSSRIQTLPHLLVAYGIVAGLGITILGLGLQASVIARWFVRQRGLAIGLAFAGTGVGTLILTPATAVLITKTGWRGAYISLGLLALLTIPLIAIFLRSSPAEVDAYPDGERPAAGFTFDYSRVDRRGWTMRQVMRSPGFWLIILAGLGTIGPLRMLTVHQLAAMGDSGVDQILAATIVGLTGLVTTVAFILWGALSDKIGRRQAYTLGSICLLAAMLILGNLNRVSGTGWLILYAVMLGLGEGSRSSLLTAVASDMFPGPALGGVNGAVGSAFGAGAAFFPWLAGRIFDQTNSYTIAYQVAAVAILFSLLALWLAPMVVCQKEKRRLYV